MVKRKRLLATALFVVVLCVVYALSPFAPIGFLCGSFDTEARKHDDAARGWLHSWDGEYNWNEFSDYRTVPVLKMPQAELLLQTAALVPLTEAQALELSGGQAAAKPGKPYLLRAVGAFQGSLHLEVCNRANGDIWVGSGAISRCPVPIQRLAIVAWLDQQPKNVYVTFAVAR